MLVSHDALLLAKPNGLPHFIHTHRHTLTTVITEAVHMTEPRRGLFYLPIICFWTGRVDADVLASLAPPVHLSGEKLGWTLLVCMVADLRRGHLEVSWSSASEGHISMLPYIVDTDRKHRGHSAVAVITVATTDWPSYRCSASHRRHKRVTRRHQSSPPGHEEQICSEDEAAQDVVVWTNAVTVALLRLLLVKIIAFNTIMTIHAVIK
ncbi:uncharacterized protein LOC130525547 [Takifugu flavidus]|nr:uncharacterized protein LOC130525547 [Takifugu flavidus]